MSIRLHITINFPCMVWNLIKHIIEVSTIHHDRVLNLSMELSDLPSEVLLSFLTSHLSITVCTTAMHWAEKVVLFVISPSHVVLKTVLGHPFTLNNGLIYSVVQELAFAQVKQPSLVADLHLKLEHLIQGHVWRRFPLPNQLILFLLVNSINHPMHHMQQAHQFMHIFDDYIKCGPVFPQEGNALPRVEYVFVI